MGNGSVKYVESLEDSLCFRVIYFQFNHPHVPVTLCGNDTFTFQYLEVSIYLVVSAIDYANKIRDMRFPTLGQGQQYSLSARRSNDLFESQPPLPMMACAKGFINIMKRLEGERA